MNKLSTLLIYLFYLSTHVKQTLPYNINKISKNRELNFAFTDKRGIESKNGIIYYVENNLQVLSAYKQGKLKWRTNIIMELGNPAVGAAEIRYIELNGDEIFVVFGKHNFASVHIADGRVKDLGAD